MSTTHYSKRIGSAIAAHAEWKNQLVHAILTGWSPLSREQLTSAKTCELGQWLDDLDLTSAPDREDVQTLHNLHDKFHALAGEVLDLALARDTDAAEVKLLGEYTAVSDRIVRMLADLKR